MNRLRFTCLMLLCYSYAIIYQSEHGEISHINLKQFTLDIRHKLLHSDSVYAYKAEDKRNICKQSGYNTFWPEYRRRNSRWILSTKRNAKVERSRVGLFSPLSLQLSKLAYINNVYIDERSLFGIRDSVLSDFHPLDQCYFDHNRLTSQHFQFFLLHLFRGRMGRM